MFAGVAIFFQDKCKYLGYVSFFAAPALGQYLGE